MATVTVQASATYDVLIGRNLLDSVGERTAALVQGRQAAIISDTNVYPLYGKSVKNSLQAAGFEVADLIFEAGERSKTSEELIRILSGLAGAGLTRIDTVIALGGGVAGDMGGLAASLYLRGIACVQIPTTLLAMVDSSVGGKTAVDLPEGKNLVGTFTQPVLVLCDLDTLGSLPREVCAEGFAEVIKYGMIRSGHLLEVLGEHTIDSVFAGQNAQTLEDIITECVSIKRDVVDADERDHGERQLLNFGHTIGHAVERLSDFRIYHGEGVAIGMAIMTRACVRMGRCPEQCGEILTDLLRKYQLPDRTDFPPDQILQAARADKKRRGESITLIEPDAVGNCILHKTDLDELKEIIERGQS